MVDNYIIHFLVWTLVLVISSSACMYANDNSPSKDLSSPNSIEEPIFPANADIRIDPVNKTIIYLKGTNLLPPKQDKNLPDQTAQDTAISFIDHFKAQFKLDNPDKELRCVAVNSDNLGLVHIKFQQVFNGIDIWGKEINVHLDRSLAVNLVQGKYVPTPRHMKITPVISSAVAYDKAAKALNIKQVSGDRDSAQLVIFAKSSEDVIGLAYKVEMPNWLAFVDAKSGEIVDLINLRQTDRNTFNPLGR